VIDFAELSDPGLDPDKQVNEDASLFLETPHGQFAAVCDGMGGHASGREASQLAMRTLAERLQASAVGTPPSELLRSALTAANAAVYALGGPHTVDARPGSTCVALLLDETGATIAHAGDSRAMLVRNHNLVRLTRDHSLVQEWVDQGLLAPEQALYHPDANKITRALGLEAEVEIDVRAPTVALLPGDVFLLASDGLTDLLQEPEIRDLVERRIGLGPAVVCQDLVALANRRGGYDNVTVQVVHVIEAPSAGQARAKGHTLPLHEVETTPAVPGAAPVAAAPVPQPAAPAPAVPPGAPLSREVPPTVFDEPAWGRTTQPDLGTSAAAPTLLDDTRREPQVSRPPRQLGLRPAMLIAALGAVVVLAVLAIVGVRLLRGLATDTREVPAPSAPPTASAPPTSAPSAPAAPVPSTN
jgi:serine/threonine protein phosphatase PrpC